MLIVTKMTQPRQSIGLDDNDTWVSLLGSSAHRAPSRQAKGAAQRETDW